MDEWNPLEAIDSLMDHFARPCIFIHRPYPPLRAPDHRSKLGGLPNLPQQVEWPHGRTHPRNLPPRTVPLHFLAQIDCAALALVSSASEPLLPASGMLYFFINTDDGAAWDQPNADDYRRVLYVPQVAADCPPRLPPAEIPVIGGEFPSGYYDGHRPNDPLTRRMYYEWPVQFVGIDSYPATDAVRTTVEWARLAAEWRARADADKAFDQEWGDDSSIGDIYQDRNPDRMHRAMCAALGLPEPAPYSEVPVRIKDWRHVGEEMGVAFPPTAAFASEIAASIENYFATEIARREREYGIPDSAAAPPPAPGIGAAFRRLLGGRDATTSAPPAAPPHWIEELRGLRRESEEWLSHLRTMVPSQVLAPEERERFLAWLDSFVDRKWAWASGSGGTGPSVSGNVRYAYQNAIFQIGRLTASRPELRVHFPDQLYRRYTGPNGASWPRHQMLGWFPSSQSARPMDDPMIPLLMLKYDECLDFRFGDVGEVQFFISPADLRARNFSRVEVQLQGG